jgi:transcriptional regulator with XRE-family HTH domain
MQNREDSRDTEIARRVRETRERSGFSQEYLGSKLGLSKVGYGHYERGTHSFSVDQLFQLSRILGRSVEYFLGLDCQLTPDEDELLSAFRQLRYAELRRAALGAVKAMVTAEEQQ